MKWLFNISKNIFTKEDYAEGYYDAFIVMGVFSAISGVMYKVIFNLCNRVGK